MENHTVPITMTKKMWNLVRVFFLMARKGVSSKRKLLLDINLMLKKGKVAGKALVGTLIFHHHRHHHRYSSSSATHILSSSTRGGKDEYEFSCSNTPAHYAMFNFLHHHLPALHGARNKYNKGEIDMATECPEFFLDETNYESVNRVLDSLDGEQGAAGNSLSSSPFPLGNNIVDDRSKPVDEAAEDFINRFYSHLRQQRLTPGPYGAE